MRTHLHPPPGAVPVVRSLRVERAPRQEHDGHREDDRRIAFSRKPPEVEQDREGEPPVRERPRARGVVRLLREGHFRGAADARLRIRFHDTLIREQQAEVKEVVEKGIEQIVEHVAEPVDALVASDRLSEEQADALDARYGAFKADALEAGAAFAASETLQPEQITTSLRDAFAAFRTSVQHLLQPNASDDDLPAVDAVSPTRLSAEETEAPEESDDQAAETTPSASPFADFLSGLADVFTQALEALTEAIQHIDRMPPLLEPRHRSPAYEKFVAAYADLHRPAETIHRGGFEAHA